MCEAKVESLNIQHAFLVLTKPTRPGHSETAPPDALPPDGQLGAVASELEQLHQIADDHKEKLRVALVQQVHRGRLQGWPRSPLA